MVLPFPIKKVLIYYLEQYQRSYSQQVKLAKRLLAINKLVPLYISNKVILFPVKQQRAPLQVYLNAQAIVGLTSNSTGTIVTFDNSIQFKIDEPYTLIYKKWQESLLLFHLVQKSTTFY
ncbi:competence protein ComK [Staphylococcus sp. NRL 19/737]|nr:competence protein ComK [Staphylococcus sp. NRL 19/737]